MAGTKTSGLEKFLTHLTQKAPVAIKAAERSGTMAAAIAVKHSVLASAASRGWKPAGRWVAIRPLTPNLAEVRLAGARAYWAERGTKEHPIKPRRAEALGNPAKGFGPVDHVTQRAKGREFWFAGVAAGRPLINAAYSRSVGAALVRAFGG